MNASTLPRPRRAIADRLSSSARETRIRRGFFLRLLKLLRRESYCVLSLSETYYVECSGSAATVRYDEARHQPSAVTIGLYVRPEFPSKSTEHAEISI